MRERLLEERRWTPTRRVHDTTAAGREYSYRRPMHLRLPLLSIALPTLGWSPRHLGLGLVVWLIDEDGGCPGARLHLGPFYVDTTWMRFRSKRQMRKLQAARLIAETEEYLTIDSGGDRG